MAKRREQQGRRRVRAEGVVEPSPAEEATPQAGLTEPAEAEPTAAATAADTAPAEPQASGSVADGVDAAAVPAADDAPHEAGPDTARPVDGASPDAAAVADTTAGADTGAETPPSSGRLSVSALEGLGDEVRLSYRELGAALERTCIEEVIADDLLAVLVAPGAVIARFGPAAEGEATPQGGCPAAGPNVTEQDGDFTADLLGYLHITDERVSVLPAIWVSADGLQAYLIHLPSPVPKPELQAEWLRAAIAERGITAGIDEEAVAGLTGAVQPATDKSTTLIAVGSEAQNGSDSVIDYEIDVEKRAGRPLADGSIDLRERNAAVGVEADQVVGRLVRATPGQPGRNVRGEALAATDGVAKDFTAGDNVRAESGDEGMRFVAEVDGNVSIQGDTIHVRPVYTVSGDVDYDTGNIDVPGDVEISGSVRTGFRVKAGGTVTVGGTVEPGAEIHSRGDVIVSKGIFGDRTRVVALGAVTTKFIQNSTVVVQGDLTVGAYIINGQVRVGGAVRVEAGGGSRGGSIIGGQVVATGGIEARLIGSAETDRTVVGVGAAAEDTARATQLRQQHTTMSRSLDELKARLGVSSASDRDQIRRLLARTPATRLDTLEAGLKQLRALERQYHELEGEIEALDQRITKTLGQARIRSTERVFADVQIQFGAVTSNLVNDLVGGCEFYRSPEGKIQWRAQEVDDDASDAPAPTTPDTPA